MGFRIPKKGKFLKCFRALYSFYWAQTLKFLRVHSSESLFYTWDLFKKNFPYLSFLILDLANNVLTKFFFPKKLFLKKLITKMHSDFWRYSSVYCLSASFAHIWMIRELLDFHHGLQKNLHGFKTSFLKLW